MNINIEYPNGQVIYLTETPETAERLYGLRLNGERPVRIEIFGEPSDKLLDFCKTAIHPALTDNVFIHGAV